MARLTVLFDRDCAFCRWTVRQISFLDRGKKIEFVPLQDASQVPGRPDLAALAVTRPLEQELHVLLPDGQVRSGGRAMIEVLSVLPGGALFRLWPRVPGLSAAIDLGYRWVAGHRGPLSRALRIG